MRVLVVDIGGTNVKILASGEKTPRKFPSGPKLTPRKMVVGVKALAAEWKYDAVAIGYPGQVLDGLGHRPLDDAGGRPGSLPRHARRLPRDGRTPRPSRRTCRC